TSIFLSLPPPAATAARPSPEACLRKGVAERSGRHDPCGWSERAGPRPRAGGGSMIVRRRLEQVLHAALRAAGAQVALATNIDEALAALTSWDVVRPDAAQRRTG